MRTAATLTSENDRVVLGPADDGGYYLLGMKAAHAHLFADIARSTDSVAQTTRLRAAQLGLEVVELPSWYDVDDRPALDRLLRETAAPAITNGLLPYAAPGTSVALSRMELRVTNLNFAAE